MGIYNSLDTNITTYKYRIDHFVMLHVLIPVRYIMCKVEFNYRSEINSEVYVSDSAINDRYWSKPREY